MEPQAKKPRSEIVGEGENPSLPEQTSPLAQESYDFQKPSGGGGSSADIDRPMNAPGGNPNGLSGRSRPAPLEGKDAGMQNFSSVGKAKPCMKFFSTSGCPFGESCHFLHFVPGGLGSLGMAPVVSFIAASATVLQKKAPATIRDPSTKVNGYKTKLCNRFNTPEGCRFGDQCHFAHGGRELRLPSAVQPNKRPMPSRPLGSAHPVGLGNGGPNFPNPYGYPVPPGNVPNLAPHAYPHVNPPAQSGNNRDSASYPTGPFGENVPVY